MREIREYDGRKLLSTGVKTLFMNFFSWYTVPKQTTEKYTSGIRNITGTGSTRRTAYSHR